jgi:uncharacterized protein YdbL (DUF1318 family)
MRIGYLKYLGTLLFIAVFFTAAVSSADTIKERMRKRLPIIKELKANGIVGENNKGFLEFLGQKHEKEDVVKEHNEDRLKIYTEIAKKYNASVETVGKRRALKLRTLAMPGEWIQEEDGKWIQKK